MNEARREYLERWRQENKERIRETNRAWDRNNRKRARAADRANYQINKGLIPKAEKPKANPKTHAPALISAARVRAEEGLDKPRREPCTCRNFSSCIPCRNQERRRATAAGEIPEYRLKMIAQIVAIGD
jgi:hypothetical protein